MFNGLLVAFLILFAVTALCRWLLMRLNIRHLQRHGQEIPEVFRGEIDGETLVKITDYTIESSRFRSCEHLFDDSLILVLLLSGILPWLLSLILSWNLHFIPSGLIFFGVIIVITGLPGIPFTLYHTFVIEKRHGFSTTTPGLWLTDLAKGLVVSACLLGLLLGSFLSLLFYTPETWWFWAWLLFALFQLLMLWLFPVLIAPLFNRYEPVKDASLNEALVALMSRVGLKTKGVYQVDEGKRSRHTNAYFTGLGKTKRIVLYDTLLASHRPEEILSVLAHEIGHWKKKHLLKQLAFMEAASLVIFYLAYRITVWPPLYETFGFPEVIPYVGLLLLGFLSGPVFFFLSPLGAMTARRFEREADDFAFALTGTHQPFIDALKRLAKDNLANLHPHPLYAWFYYSHPPLTERIARLQQPRVRDVTGPGR